MFHERLVAGNFAGGNRAPNAQGRVDLSGAICGEAPGGFLLDVTAVLSKDDAIGLVDIGVAHVEYDVASRPSFPAVEGCHLTGEYQAWLFLFAGFVNTPACVRHRFEDVAREQILIELGTGLPSDAPVRELLACFFDL